MSWDPIEPVENEAEAIDVDPENPSLVVIKVPLNKNPAPDWEYFFENQKFLKGPIHSLKVRGDQILVKSNKDRPVEALEQTYEYLENTNDRYRKFLEKNEDKWVNVEEKELEEITEKIRKM